MESAAQTAAGIYSTGDAQFHLLNSRGVSAPYRETMARFRPEMQKFYYDAMKYDTYLEQLGVKFPTLTKP